MRIRIKAGKELLAGALIVAIGCVPLFIGPGYPVGTAARMGPGYFPVLIGGLLVAVGALIALRAFLVEQTGGLPLRPRGILLVSAAMAVFAAAVDVIGFVPSSLVLVIVAALAGPAFRPREVALLAAVLAVGSAVVFVYFLGMPFSLWPF